MKAEKESDITPETGESLQLGYKLDANLLAAKRGGLCLSENVPTVSSRVWWKCGSPDHPAWEAVFGRVRGWGCRKGSWCKQCKNEGHGAKIRNTVQFVADVLLKRGIHLLTPNYAGVESVVDCECITCLHRWSTRYRNIQHGHGCPECSQRKIADKLRLPKQSVIRFLEKHGVRLASEYQNVDQQLQLVCVKCEHRWERTFKQFKSCPGCPKCRRKQGGHRRHSLEHVRKTLSDLGYVWLGGEYTGANSPLTVRFPKCGHTGPITFAQVTSRNRSGLCPKCAPTAKKTRDDYNALAAKLGVSLVSMGSSVKAQSLWNCPRPGHGEFRRAYAEMIRPMSACPECNKHLAERQCRAAMEQIFGIKFRKLRLAGMRGIGGLPLELDAYSAELKLAVEHNGLQHYKPNKFGNMSDKDARQRFAIQQEHDRRRRDYCARAGIRLVEIRQLGKVTKLESLKAEIVSQCVQLGVRLPSNIAEISLEPLPSILTTDEEANWNQVLKLVTAQGYKLLTAEYPGMNGKLDLVCPREHDRRISVREFIEGRVCRKCSLEDQSTPVVGFLLDQDKARANPPKVFVAETTRAAAALLGTSATAIQGVAKGVGVTCCGYAIARIKRSQVEEFRRDENRLAAFCAARWPSGQTFDRFKKLRRTNGKPLRRSDGRVFASAAAAARELGVTKAAVLIAVRKATPCRGFHFLRTVSGDD